jgi:hypothetical protein
LQVIYGANTASNILFTAQKRLIRPVYAQTQGFPYAASLDPSFRNTDGSFRTPLSTDTAGAAAGQGTVPLSRSSAPFTYQGSITPGQVLVKTLGQEQVCIANGAASAVQPMGLLGQWLGGTFDNVGTSNQVGVWMGPDSTYDLLAPAWNDTGLAAAIAAAGAGIQVNLYAGSDGRLGIISGGGSQVAVARVIQRISAAVLRIQLLV